MAGARKLLLMDSATQPTTHQTAETQLVRAAGIEFAFRRFGSGAELPLTCA
jgi:hypothetical protein